MRIVVLFNVGPPFGGFRIAAPGLFGLDDPAVYETLEKATHEAFELLRAHPPSAWSQLAAGESFRAAVPLFEGREGAIDVTGDATDDAAGAVVLRAFLPFAAWPLGGWAFYQAWNRGADGDWTPLSQDALAALW